MEDKFPDHNSSLKYVILKKQITSSLWMTKKQREWKISVYFLIVK